jgi:hypothetical protein
MLSDRPGSQSAFQFIPKVLDGVKIRALCRLVKFFHTDLNKTFMYGLHFLHRGIVMLIMERAFLKLLPQSWIESSRMSLYAVAFRFPFTRTKWPCPNYKN